MARPSLAEVEEVGKRWEGHMATVNAAMKKEADAEVAKQAAAAVEQSARAAESAKVLSGELTGFPKAKKLLPMMKAVMP